MIPYSFQIYTTLTKMQTHFTLTLSTLLFYFLITFTFSSTFFFSTSATSASNKPQDLIHSSCIHSRYPRLCLRTLSNYVGPINTTLDVAQAALRVSLAHAGRASKYLKALSATAPDSSGQSPNDKRQRVALKDCVEQMADSVDELRRSLEELQHLRPETFRWQMSNTQTWVSAAITDGDTCLDGFVSDGGDNDGKVKRGVKRRVTDVAMVTSNALYMINRLGQGDARKGKHRPGGSFDSKN
ncbi:PREDICTED: 21 kDa protein-like [Lupinus angustifolius]|nr:PREDICTED: 21 kDa protein-like [Lupinus angustifolius]XP_019415980.1 PREDICTED: 21 kDa protein-like [Lupinus angustifolius]